MEKRILLAFVLSFGVLYAFRAYFTPPSPTETPAVTTPAEPAVAAQQDPVDDAPKIIVEMSPPAPGTTRQAEAPEDITIDTTLYTATISNVGGVLKSYKLKTYTDAEGKAIELIDSVGASKGGWPLAIITGDAAVDDALSKAPFVVLRDGDRIDFEYAGSGFHVQKSFDFSRLNYEFNVATNLTKDGNGLPHSIVWQGGFGDQSVPNDPVKLNVVYQAEGDFTRINVAGLEGAEFTTPRMGVEDQYFLAVFLFQQPVPMKVTRKDYPGANDKTVATASVAGPQQPQTSTHIYAGPKSESWLRRADPDLVAVIDYGMFEFLARPLMLGLLWIHSYVANFGWAIVILTILLNFLLFPLRLKQQVSMRKMSKIQPQMKTLQDKYKKLKAADPRRAELQQEMMGLYKQHGVNPMGGCLPLLLQMPFFFAILSILSVAIEMRQAPWILWIRDLSQHDPYYILPILFAVTMVITQKMTPTPVSDPVQAKMMMIMPLMLSFMFLWVSSGLALYWVSSNVVGIGQQFFINKYWSAEPPPKSKFKDRQKELPPEK